MRLPRVPQHHRPKLVGQVVRLSFVALLVILSTAAISWQEQTQQRKLQRQRRPIFKFQTTLESMERALLQARLNDVKMLQDSPTRQLSSFRNQIDHVQQLAQSLEETKPAAVQRNSFGSLRSNPDLEELQQALSPLISGIRRYEASVEI